MRSPQTFSFLWPGGQNSMAYHARVARLLEVENLSVHYGGVGAPAAAVRDVSLHLEPGEAAGLLGESGCGKSTLLLAILGLLPPEARVVRGTVRFRGRDLLGLAERERRSVRGAEIALVFQDPALALNPVRRVGAQVAEVVGAHRAQSARRCREDALAVLEEVGLPDPRRLYDAYPHELSGGQRQRVVIAQALVCRPALLLADEPTGSLDATTAADLLALLRSLQERFGLAVLMASHDLGALSVLARRVMVMYAGGIVEEGSPADVFGGPLHPYTRALAAAYPRPATATRTALPLGAPIPGLPPDPAQGEPGCAFEPRCPDRRSVCREKAPAETAPAAGRHVRCVLHGG
jgi:oligopeptide/dipeptide ABC transporter ATP-binding protein